MRDRVFLYAVLLFGCSETLQARVPSDVGRPEDVEAAVVDVLSCPEGMSVCDGECVTLDESTSHCGLCGRRCGEGERCVAGICAARCAAPTSACVLPTGEECIDLTTDREHCGACESRCDDGLGCVGGVCVVQCLPGENECDGVCRDFSSDRSNCGACRNLCVIGQSCIDGACALVCSTGMFNCGNRCVDTMSDGANCGACARRCATGARCVEGTCRGAACGPLDTSAGRCDGSTIVRCVSNEVVREACPLGQLCRTTGGVTACAEIEGARRIVGTVTFQNRPAGVGGVASLRYEPAVGVPLELLDERGTMLAVTLTNAMGRYQFNYDAPDGAMRQVRAVMARSDANYNFVVRDYAGATFSFTTPAFVVAPEVTRDLAIPIGGNSGAVSIFETMRMGFDFLRTFLTTRPAALYITWERGRATGPMNSSFFSGASSSMFINGSDADPDEFDPAVHAHEFSHYIQRWYSRSDNPGGPHDGSPADPNLAFGEGGATFLGALITGNRFYIDAGVTRLRIVQDLQNIPMVRSYSAVLTQPITQPISEWLVAGTQYAMFRSSTDTTTQTRRAMNVITSYFRRTPFPDRGEPGADLVEYLDGYLCRNMGADRSTIMNYLVNSRRFPYDFDYMAVCR
jgi:hypothetical protein